MTLTVDTLPSIIPLGQPIDLNAYTVGFVENITASLFTPTLTLITLAIRYNHHQ
ncbi:hypothetical protein BGP_6541 [Beggiatoa sp. PS]|nr:hypothetical protein BGP_6541 [Beggiatoa sp. PS]